VPTFSLPARDPDWIPRAPIVISRTLSLGAPPDRVFDCLADLAGWSDWYRGMRKGRLDVPSSGVGALRTVWLGSTRVQERFVVWEPGHRLTFVLTRSNTPGIHAMAEDWALAPDPQDPARTALSITIGVEAARLLRPFPALVRAALKGPLGGVSGLTARFP
jgi:uncharacterized protein YndB with AHSA1/START domain